MDLDKSVGEPKLPHRRFNRGLDAKYQLILRLPQFEKAPVQFFVTLVSVLPKTSIGRMGSDSEQCMVFNCTSI
jgi:hypothetical protein